jgi:hypothetical protein
MTRNGKIARLPNAIREQLNQRLFDGEEGKNLVEWLNSLPKVQAVMKVSFEGRPITEDNISEWKKGGYLTWEAGERLAEKVTKVLERTDALEKVAQQGLTDRIALILAANLALEMERLQDVPDGLEKIKLLRELRISLLALKRMEVYSQRLKIEGDRHRKTEKAKTKRMTVEQRVQTVKALLGINEGYDGTKNPELTRPPVLVNRTESESIGVNRTGSE